MGNGGWSNWLINYCGLLYPCNVYLFKEDTIIKKTASKLQLENMNQKIKEANRKVKHLLDNTIFNNNISVSMKYFQETSYRFHFLLAFMYLILKGKKLSQEDAIQAVPIKIASRATRVTELKKAVKAGFIIERVSEKDKRSRIYEPSKEMFDDFIELAEIVFPKNF
tara:strand:+ start:18 stop:515 length:498 start_codon:yes stop_codon:yes gene_type:complete